MNMKRYKKGINISYITVMKWEYTYGKLGHIWAVIRNKPIRIDSVIPKENIIHYDRK